MLLILDSQEERGHKSNIPDVWNIISNEFLLFSIHSSCWIQDAKSMKNMQALKGVFDQRALLECVFIMNLYIIIIFY